MDQVENGIIRFSVIKVFIPDSLAISPDEKAKIFINEYKDLFDIDDPINNLRNSKPIFNQDNSSRIQFVQSINGIPVYGSNITVNLSADGEITSIIGGYIPGKINSITPSVSALQAENLIKTEYSIDSSNISSSSLLYLDDVIFGEISF